MNIYVVFFLLSFIFSFGAGPFAQAKLDGLDTFGSKKISSIELSKQYGLQIETCVSSYNQRNFAQFSELEVQIEKAIKDQFQFSYVKLSLIRYFSPKPGQYVTVDVVEPQDVGRRMSFLPEPKGQFADPDGLIDLWGQYQTLAHKLQADGKFEYPKTCPAWHCTHGFENPDLAPFLEKFNKLVPPNEKKLAEILKQDRRPQFRANAAFLLAHTKSAPFVADYVLGSIRDPSQLVRNNAVRVLSDLAQHPEAVEIPVGPLLQVLDFPATTDRNKAAATLIELSLKDKNKDSIIKFGGRILLEMLTLQQPNNHDPAYVVLKNISGKNFGERDYLAWEKWLSQAL